MANKDHFAILKQGKAAWFIWRKNNPRVRPDLSEVDLTEENLVEEDLHGVNLNGANLSGSCLRQANCYQAYFRQANLNHADLSGADLEEADLDEADLRNANLSGAKLHNAILYNTNFTGANLEGASLIQADLRRANLSDSNLCRANLSSTRLDNANLTAADLRGADLINAHLVGTTLNKANLIGCFVYGIAAWDLKLEQTIQADLVITRPSESSVTVDNLEVAQFIYLLLHNEKVRDVINTITTKVVLILGSFASERKAVLDAIRDELRKRNYLPVLFGFDKPASRDITETVSTLAHLSRFIIADITDPRSIPQELQTIVPNLPSVPIQPLLLSSQREYGMFEHFTRYPWVLPIHHYNDMNNLLASLADKVIAPAEAKAKELQSK